jgi:D-alanyl-lipoteichoic acid acyltransferase DltB (MBOAT superfamily)
MVTFGLWHRGAVLFAVWGLYHGVLLVLHREWQHFQRWSDFRWPQYVATPVSWAVTFAAISFGWIFFRAENLQQSFAMVAAIFSPASYVQHILPRSLYVLIAALAVGYFIVIALPPLRRDQSAGICTWLPLEFKCALYGAMFYLAVLHTAEPQQFIYFQF